MGGGSLWRSLIGGALCLALAAQPVAAQARGAEGFSDEAVEEAIRKAKDFLWNLYDDQVGHWPIRQGYEGGHTGLAVLALLSAGEKPEKEKLKRALMWLSELDTTKTYVLGIRAQVWAILARDNRRIRPLLFKDVDRLVKSIAQPTAPNAAQPGQPARVVRPARPMTVQEAVRRNPKYGMYTYTSAGKPVSGGDHSNTQFGILGTWAGASRNIEGIPRWYWELVFEHYRATQNADGGWSYTIAANRQGKSSLNMTAAGLASSFVAFDNLFNDQFVKCGVNTDVPMLTAALNWFDKNFGVVGGGWGHYGMYAVERVGLASGRKYFGDKDWYKIGAVQLLRSQRNGGWGDIVNTSFALLFLVRGRAPVLYNRLEYPGDWNNRPRALANLSRWTSDQFEGEFNWQIINLKVPVEEWHDAPVLLISGNKKPEFTDEHLDKLREFVWQGGLIFTVAECGGGLRNGFDRAWRGTAARAGGAGEPGLYEKLFPGRELTQLPTDHPIYTAHFEKLRRRVPLWGVSNGIRLLALHTNYDLPKAWQTNAVGGERHAFELAFNIPYFATDQGISQRSRGTSPWPEKKPFVPLRVVRVARVKYQGNWDPEPLAWERFGRLMGAHWQTKVVAETVAAGELDAGKHRLAALTGTEALSLSGEETKALKAYVGSGGMLVMDAAGGSKAFADSAAKLLQELFPEAPLRRLSSLSGLYRLEGMPIESVAYRRAAGERFGSSRSPRLEGLMHAGRLAVILSREDLTAGLAGYACATCVGYKPGTPAKPGSAEKLMRNIVLHAIQPTKPPGAGEGPAASSARE